MHKVGFCVSVLSTSGDPGGMLQVHKVGKTGEYEIGTDLAGGGNAWALACRWDTPSGRPAAVAGGDYDKVLILNEQTQTVRPDCS